MPEVRLMLGDCLEKMEEIDARSVDAIATDPPYGLKFMGKGWDHGVPGVPYWEAALRILKPGGYIAVFGGTRTFHRQVCAIEDAGFEIRDTIMWMYGSGFPKGKGCLKPAWEPITLARKPGPKVLPLGIDECRIGTEITTTIRSGNSGAHGRFGKDDRVFVRENPPGRWPANVVHDGSDEVVEAFPDRKTTWVSPKHKNNRSGEFLGALSHPGAQGFNDSGSAARFYYCAKASKADRDEGNTHPTVKPTSLMQWLVRLIARPGELLADPFMGSGSTGKACIAEGVGFIGIEREPGYFAVAEKRINGPAEPETEDVAVVTNPEPDRSEIEGDGKFKLK